LKYYAISNFIGTYRILFAFNFPEAAAEEPAPKLYLLPPNLPVYNPTPISELEKRKNLGIQP